MKTSHVGSNGFETSIESSLGSYRMRLLALASAAALAPKAEAALVTFDFNQTITGSGGLFFNPINGQTSAGIFILGFTPFYSGGGGTYAALNIAAGTGYDAAVIGAGSYFFGYSGAVVSSFSTGSGWAEAGLGGITKAGFVYGYINYVGLRMSDQGAGHDETYYGWASFVANGGGSSITLLQTTFDNVDLNPVTIGEVAAIPEPANAVLLLSSGAAGLALLRRRRKQKADAATVAVASETVAA